MPTAHRIPFVDLGAQFATIRGELLAAIAEVIDTHRFILGPRVEALEAAIAEICGTRHAVGCASGSDALILALAASGVEERARVVTSPFTFFASAGSVVHAGGRPAFCDIDPATFNMDPALLSGALTPDTKAVMAVHLFGQCADMDPILAVSGASGVTVIEDAAQAIGAGYAGTDGMAAERFAGAMGLIGCFSFFPTKNLGGCGDGGMMTTSDARIAERLRLLRAHGGRQMYHHEMVGWNSRLDEMQAAALQVKVRHLSDWSAARRARAETYDRLLEDSGLAPRGLVVPPARRPGSRHVFHQYTVRAKRRDTLRDHLHRVGIGSGVYYPVPLHLQECFRPLGYAPGDFPHAERAAEEVLSLPVYPELSEPAQRTVVAEIAAFYRL
jgi:dTDP-4-amino-4,6-dideoxygalactose transaminase